MHSFPIAATAAAALMLAVDARAETPSVEQEAQSAEEIVVIGSINKFDSLADQIDRSFDEFELETEDAGPVFQFIARVAF